MRKLLANLFFRPPEDEHYPSDKYCSICEGRLWPWTKTTRLYSLGMTRAHLECAANFLRNKLAEMHVIPREPRGKEAHILPRH